MVHRRSGLEVSFTILKAIRAGTRKPTRIMYASNMSWMPLKAKLGQLVEKGLVTEEPIETAGDKRTKVEYHLTENGENILNTLTETIRTIGSL